MAIYVANGSLARADTTVEPPSNPTTQPYVTTDTIGALATAQFGKPPSSASSADPHGCTWYPGAGVAATTGGADVTKDSKVINGVTYHLFTKLCTTAKTSGLVWVAQLSSKSLAQASTSRVEQLLPHPTLHSAPKSGAGIVKVGMWFWTDAGDYAPKSVTAWIPTPTGILSATTTATPAGLVFAPGEPDASTTTCAGPGEPWLPQYGDDLPSSCMYTYRHSSEIDPSGTFTAQLSTSWHITWKSNVGPAGDLGSYSTTTTQQVTIREIQAVVTG